MIREMVWATCIFAATNLATAVHAEAQPEWLTLEQVLSGFHERYGFPGATAAMALPDGSVVTAATGVADLTRPARR
jgi:D-alanyl-D-alanine carboxypeptidase